MSAEDIDLGPVNTNSASSPLPASDLELLNRVLGTSTDELIPPEEIELPSKGYYYGWPNGIVIGRAWGISVDKCLNNTRMIQNGHLMASIVAKHVRFPDGFHVDDLLVGDMLYLFYYLRGMTHGNIYEYVFTNPTTNDRSINRFDMNELYKTVVMAKDELRTEPFRVSLPYLTKRLNRDFWVELRFLRVRDLASIKTELKQQNRAGVVHSTGFETEEFTESEEDRLMLEYNIVSVMGERSRPRIREFVATGKLHYSDSSTIKNWLKENEPSINTNVTQVDPLTGQSYTLPLPLTEAFFRPEESARLRKRV